MPAITPRWGKGGAKKGSGKARKPGMMRTMPAKAGVTPMTEGPVMGGGSSNAGYSQRMLAMAKKKR